MTTDKSAAPAPQLVADREALVEVIRDADIEWSRGWNHVKESLYVTIADALLARGLRLPTDAQPETLAWAVVGEGGKIEAKSCWPDRIGAYRYKRSIGGENIVRVAIRVLDDAGKGE